MTAEEVAAGIVARETDRDGRREDVSYGVLDPSAFAVLSGPSIAETLMRHGAVFRRADNTRSSSISHDRRKGGWDQLRARLKGDGDGRPLIYFFSTCRDIIRLCRFSSTTSTTMKMSRPTVTIIAGIAFATPVFHGHIWRRCRSKTRTPATRISLQTLSGSPS